MAADDIAILRVGHRSDDWPARVRGLCTPFNREAQLCSGLRMRGEPDMFGAIGTVHRKLESQTTRRDDGPCLNQQNEIARLWRRESEL